MAEYSVSTPGEVTQLKPEIAVNGKAFASNGDIVFVYVKLLDQDGNLVSRSTADVTLSVSGDAEIISPVKVSAEAGIASFIIRSGKNKGQIKLKAITPGIKEGVLLANVL
ncbi:hypothetical protein D3C85_1567280 [compost metagenome]